MASVIQNKKQINEYELIVYKYMFISELGMPLFDEKEIEIDSDSFTVHMIPDALEFDRLRKLDDAFYRFDLIFMPNVYNLLKIRFNLIRF